MIVKMQKVTLLCAQSAREDTLDALRELGIMHVTHVRLPEGEELETARNRSLHLRRVLEMLPKHPQARPSGHPAEEVIENVWRLIQERKSLQEQMENLEHERLRMTPFGSFEPADIKALAAQGIVVRIYQAGPKQEITVPEGFTYLELKRDKQGIWFALAGHGEPAVQAQEARLPELSLRAIEQKISETQAALANNDRQMQEYAGDHPVISQIAAQAEDHVRYLEVRTGMGAEAPVQYLQGFCPEKNVPALRQQAARHGWGLIVQEPEASDPVPTLLENPAWVKPIKPLLDFIGILPGYNEVDLSTPILFFFSLFFAMLVGDAAYGTIFLAASLWGRKKFKQAPPEIFQFLTVMSICTIIWGVLTGNYFGIGDAATQKPATLLPPLVPWLSDPNHVMLLCFIIGLAQLSFAHLWNIYRMRRSLQALAQVGWLCTTWTMFFFACTMVLGFAFPTIMYYILTLGVILIVLFMTPVKALKDEWFNHAMLPLNLVSNFVDVVSYIRLFAVGTAGYAVANSFNTMLAPMFGTWWTAIFAAVFLFAAHALNIVLAIMGVMVHGVRLNTLEFSGHVGMQWTGTAFQPFKRIAAATAAADGK